MRRFRNNPRQQKTLWNPMGLQVIREVTTDFSDVNSNTSPEKTYEKELGKHFKAEIVYEAAPENEAFWGNTYSFEVSADVEDVNGEPINISYLGIVASKPSLGTANDLNSSSVVLSYALTKSLERKFEGITGSFNLFLLDSVIIKSFKELYEFLVNTDAATKYSRDVYSMLSELHVSILQIKTSTFRGKEGVRLEVLTANFESASPTIFDFSWRYVPPSLSTTESQPTWLQQDSTFKVGNFEKKIQITSLSIPRVVDPEVSISCTLSITQKALDESGVQKTPFNLSLNIDYVEAAVVSETSPSVATTISIPTVVKKELLPASLIKDLKKYVKPFILSAEQAKEKKSAFSKYFCIIPEKEFFCGGTGLELAIYKFPSNLNLKNKLLAANVPAKGFLVGAKDIDALAETPLDFEKFPKDDDLQTLIRHSDVIESLMKEDFFSVALSVPTFFKPVFETDYKKMLDTISVSLFRLFFSFYKQEGVVKCGVGLTLNPDMLSQEHNRTTIEEKCLALGFQTDTQKKWGGLWKFLIDALDVTLTNPVVKKAFEALPSTTDGYAFIQSIHLSVFDDFLSRKPKDFSFLDKLLFLDETCLRRGDTIGAVAFGDNKVPNFKMLLTSNFVMSDAFRNLLLGISPTNAPKTPVVLQKPETDKGQISTPTATVLKFPTANSRYTIDRFNFGKFILDYLVSDMASEDGLYFNAKKRFVVMSAKGDKYMTFVHFPKNLSVEVIADAKGYSPNFVMVDKNVLEPLRDSPDANLVLDPSRKRFSLTENTLGGPTRGKETLFCEGKDVELLSDSFGNYFEDLRLARRISGNWDYKFSMKVSTDLKNKLGPLFANIFPDLKPSKYASFLSECYLGVAIVGTTASLQLLVMAAAEEEFPTKLKSGAKAIRLHSENLKKALKEGHTIAFDVFKSPITPAEDFLCIAKDSVTGDIIQITYKYGVTKKGDVKDLGKESSLIRDMNSYIQMAEMGLASDRTFKPIWDQLSGFGPLGITQPALKTYLNPVRKHVVMGDISEPAKKASAVIDFGVTLPVAVLGSADKNVANYVYSYQIPYRMLQPYVGEASFASDVIGESEIYFSTKIPQNETDVLVISNGDLMLKWAKVRVKKNLVVVPEEKPLVQQPFALGNTKFSMNSCVLPKPLSSGEGSYELWMGETEVTQDLFKAVMGWNDSFNRKDGKNPVEGVTWFDCLVFCNKLSKLYGFEPCYTLTNIERKAVKLVLQSGLLVKLDAFSNKPVVKVGALVAEGDADYEYDVDVESVGDDTFDDDPDVDEDGTPEGKKSAWEKMYSDKEWNTEVLEIEYRPDFDVSEFTSQSPHISYADVVWDKNANGFRLPTARELGLCAEAETAEGDVDVDFENYYWHKENSNAETHPVAQLKPNKWGFYDIFGNVKEWCWSFSESNKNFLEPSALGQSYLSPWQHLKKHRKAAYFSESTSDRPEKRLESPFLFFDIGFRICQGSFPAVDPAFVPGKLREIPVPDVGQEIYQQGQVIFKINKCLIPQTDVTVSYPILMGETEVTEALFEAVMNTGKRTPSQKPVVDVTWYECIEFCNKLSRLRGLAPCYDIAPLSRGPGGEIRSAKVTWVRDADGFRLPTLFEWQTCAEAGTNDTWAGVDVEKDLVRYSWYEANSQEKIHPVGQLEPNAFGLYDMSGNVAEWCFSEHESGGRYILGGYYLRPAEEVVCVAKTSKEENDRGFWVGFRICRGSVPQEISGGILPVDISTTPDGSSSQAEESPRMLEGVEEAPLEIVKTPPTPEANIETSLAEIPGRLSTYTINAFNFGGFLLDYLGLMMQGLENPYAEDSDRLFFYRKDRVAVVRRYRKDYNVVIPFPNDLEIEVLNDSRNQLQDMILVNRAVLEAMKEHPKAEKIVVDVYGGKVFLKSPTEPSTTIKEIYLMSGEDMGRIVDNFSNQYKKNLAKYENLSYYDFFIEFSPEVRDCFKNLPAVFIALTEPKFKNFFAKCSVQFVYENSKMSLNLLVHERAVKEFPTKLPSSGNPVQSYGLSASKLAYLLSLKDLKKDPTKHRLVFDLFVSPYDSKAKTVCIARNVGNGDILQITYKNVLNAKHADRSKEDTFLNKELFSCYKDKNKKDDQRQTDGEADLEAFLRKFADSLASLGKLDVYMQKIKEYFAARVVGSVSETGDGLDPVFTETSLLSDISVNVLKAATEPEATYTYDVPYEGLALFSGDSFARNKVGTTRVFFSRDLQKMSGNMSVTSLLISCNVDLIKVFRACFTYKEVRNLVSKGIVPLSSGGSSNAPQVSAEWSGGDLSKSTSFALGVSLPASTAPSLNLQKELKANNVSFKLQSCVIPKASAAGEHYDLLMGRTEVTQELFQAVMGFNPSKFQDNLQNPVETVTWFDCISFCNKLSELLGLQPCYAMTDIEKNTEYPNSIKSAKVVWKEGANGFRLPTGKEWETCAKAGTNNTWSGTNDVAELVNYAWYEKNSGNRTHPVGELLPNEWGLYDMSGNVYEWCWDKYNPDDTDPSADRVRRGGSWGNNELLLRSANRNSNSPGNRGNLLGFRVCMGISGTSQEKAISGNTPTEQLSLFSTPSTPSTPHLPLFFLKGCEISKGEENSGDTYELSMGDAEVTQELFQAVMGFNPSTFKNDPKNPVEQVTWFDCIDFCNKLSAHFGFKPCYRMTGIKREKSEYPNMITSARVKWDENADGYRLPTEREWVTCAKAGTNNRWSGTNVEVDLEKYAWYNENSKGGTHPVEQLRPNDWGLYDMSGNVYEWCWDRSFSPEYDRNADYRASYGGSWYNDASSLFSAKRHSFHAGYHSERQGFRVCTGISGTSRVPNKNQEGFQVGEEIFILNKCKLFPNSTYTLSMGETEVTQALFEAVMGWNDSSFKDDSKNPVTNITWFDCLAFCNKLSELYDLTPCYMIVDIKKDTFGGHHIDYAKVLWDEKANGFRLPTELEWVICAKAGTQNEWSGTNNKDSLGDYAWYSKYSGNKTHPVAGLEPNEWGLYDMSGNVSEYCWDFRLNDNGKISAITRGGAYSYQDSMCSISSRFYTSANTWMGVDGIGFRICKGEYFEGRQTLPTVDVSSNLANVQVGPKTSRKVIKQIKVQVGSEVFNLNTCSIPKQKDEGVAYSLSMCTTEVTQELWQIVMGWNESHFKDSGTKNLPVENVTWFDCISFCNRLSKLSGLKPCYALWNICEEGYHIANAIVDLDETADGYRLPTEKEMEICSKAGTSNEYPGTDDEKDLAPYMWYSRNGRSTTHAVATKEPNEWGLYDMSGNVWEWCWDLYTNADGKKRRLHGGSFESPPSRVNNLSFSSAKPSEKAKDLGLRICRFSPNDAVQSGPHASSPQQATTQKSEVVKSSLEAGQQTISGAAKPKVKIYTDTSGDFINYDRGSRFSDTYPDFQKGYSLNGVNFKLNGCSLPKPQNVVLGRDFRFTSGFGYSFWMGETEVTQELFHEVMGWNESRSKDAAQKTNPVENVTWYDCLDFCNKLSKRLGLIPCYTISDAKKVDKHIENASKVVWDVKANGFRLPTLQEWQLCAKAGTDNESWAGCTTKEDLPLYAWYADNAEAKTHPVGQLGPNEWGFYDMTGNVSEFCFDGYQKTSTGIQYAVCGGSYWQEYHNLSFRPAGTVNAFSSSVGFRICMGVFSEKAKVTVDIPQTEASKQERPGLFSSEGSVKDFIPEQETFKIGSLSFNVNSCPISKPAYPEESYVHYVWSGTPYVLWMGETEVTQELFEAVMGWNDSRFEGLPKNPVERVSWFDCIDFCNRLSILCNLQPYYGLSQIKRVGNRNQISKATVTVKPKANGFSLPLAGEWEFCAKAGTNNKYAGTDRQEELEAYAWSEENSERTTHPVAELKPNAWGLYDMIGNVSEWCFDGEREVSGKSYHIAIGAGYSHPLQGFTKYLYGGNIVVEPYYESGVGFRICLRNYSKKEAPLLTEKEPVKDIPKKSPQITPTSTAFESLSAGEFLSVLNKFTAEKENTFGHNVILDSKEFLVLNSYFYAEARSCNNIDILEEASLGLIPKKEMLRNLNSRSLLITEENGLFKKLAIDLSQWREQKAGYTTISDTDYVISITQAFRDTFKSLEAAENLKKRFSAKSYDNNNDTIIFRQTSKDLVSIYLFQGKGVTIGEGLKYFGTCKGAKISMIASLPFTQVLKPTDGFNNPDDQELQKALPKFLFHLVPLEYFSLVLAYSDVIRLGVDLNRIFDKVHKEGQMRTSVYMQSASGANTFGFQGFLYRSPGYSNEYTRAFEDYDKLGATAVKKNPFDDHVISSGPNPQPVLPREKQTEVQKKAFQHLSYLASIASNSDRNSSSIPSTTSQIFFANKLIALLESLDLKTHKDKNYNVIVSIPGLNAGANAKPIAFMAHYDTVPQTRPISKLNILQNWDGKTRIPYVKNQNVDINTASYPVLKQFIGEDVIYGNGDYPYGLDDKLGLTHLITLACWLTNNRDNPKLSYPPVYLIARPDEEIGRDAVLEPLAGFLKENQVQFLYTVDGVSRFEINTVSFNAASFKMSFPKQTTKLKAPAYQVSIKLQAVSAHTATAYEEGYKPAIRIASQIYGKIKDNPNFYLQDYLASHKPAPNTNTNDPSSATLKVLVTKSSDLQVLGQVVQTVIDPYKAKGASFEIQVSSVSQNLSWDPSLVHIFNYLQQYLTKPSKFQELAENTADWEGFCDPTQIFDDGSQWGLVFRVRAFEASEMEARKLFLFTEAKKLGAQAAYRDQHSNSGDNDILPRLAHEIPLACGEDLKLPATLSPFRGGIGADALQIAGIHVCNLGTGYFAAENFRELTSLQMLYTHPLWYFYICQHFAIKDVRELAIVKANQKKLQAIPKAVQTPVEAEAFYELGVKEHHVFGDTKLDLVYCPSDIWVSSTQITQQLWQTITGQNPSKFKNALNPVENVSFLDCVDFCNKMSIKEGLKPCYSISSTRVVSIDLNNTGYRLLTEEEWKACANLSPFYFAGSNELELVGWYCGNSGKNRLPDTIWDKSDAEVENILVNNACRTHRVGGLKPNELGLYDMSGNVWEWLSPSNTTQVQATSGCFIIGGSYLNSSADCTVDSIMKVPITTRENNLGLRICKKSILD